MNVTLKQKEMLLNYLKNNADLARGRIDRKSESKRKMKDMWNGIADNINAADIGPQKSGQEWAKTWKDIKSYILKKEAKRRNCIQGTGGGLPPKVNFSTFEEDVLEFLTPEAAGMDNIPEGGIIDDEPMLQECSSRSDVCSNNNVIEKQNMSYPEIEENDDIENVPPKSAPKVNKNRKNNTFIQMNATRKEKSSHELSYNILNIQDIKLKIKKKELKIRKKTLKVQANILAQLREIKCILAQSAESIV